MDEQSAVPNDDELDEEPMDQQPLDQVLRGIRLELGQHNGSSFSPPQVTVGMLNSFSQKNVDPFIKHFINAVVPAVSKRCINSLSGWYICFLTGV